MMPGLVLMVASDRAGDSHDESAPTPRRRTVGYMGTGSIKILSRRSNENISGSPGPMVVHPYASTNTNHVLGPRYLVQYAWHVRPCGMVSSTRVVLAWSR